MRHPLLLLIPLTLPFILGACQTAHPAQAAAEPSPTPTFNQSTVQTFDLQSGQFQQAPPFGARSDRD